MYLYNLLNPSLLNVEQDFERSVARDDDSPDDNCRDADRKRRHSIEDDFIKFISTFFKYHSIQTNIPRTGEKENECKQYKQK